MPERDTLRPHHPVDHRPAHLTGSKAVPEILRGRHNERGRFILVERTTTDEVRTMTREDNLARLRQTLHRDLRFEPLDHTVRDARHALVPSVRGGSARALHVRLRRAL